MPREEARPVVVKALEKLNDLKRRVADAIEEERNYGCHLRGKIMRLESTDGVAATASQAVDFTTQPTTCRSKSLILANLGGCPDEATILDDMIIDYMLRQGCDAAAAAVAEARGLDASAVPPSYHELMRLLVSVHKQETGGLSSAVARTPLPVDVLSHTQCVPVFAHHQPASSLLAELVLEWCSVHTTKLKKLGSPLEGMVRMRAYAALVHRREYEAAVQYARAHFAQLATTQPALVKSAMGALAVPPDAIAGHGFFSEARWRDVADQLRTTHREVTCAPELSPFVLTLAAGLTVLKTPKCRPPPASPTPPERDVPEDYSSASNSEVQPSGSTLAASRATPTDGTESVGTLVSAWRTLTSTVEAHTAAAAAAAAAAAGAVTGVVASASSADAASSSAHPATSSASEEMAGGELPGIDGVSPLEAAPDQREGESEDMASSSIGESREDASGERECAVECPLCSLPYTALAHQVPTVQRTQSTIVCRLSGEHMNEHNAAIVLPDGNVYSHDALLARCDSNGAFAHPVTGEALRLDDMRRAFFL